MTSDQTPADVIGQVARVALDAMEAKQRADKEAVRAALGDLAVDLDGKEHDYRVEAWEVARALADAHLLVDPADRDAIKAPLVREIKRLQDQIARVAMEPGQDRQKAMHAYAARAERAEAEVARLSMAKVNQCDAETEAANAIADLATAEAEVARLQRMLETARAERDMKVTVREALHYRDQRDELRATVDRVRALADEWRSHYELPPIHRPPLMHWDQVADILRAALDPDGGAS